MVKKDNCWRMKKGEGEGKRKLWIRSDDVYLSSSTPEGNVAEISASRLGTLAILNASLKKLTILLTMGRMARKHGSIYIGKKGVD